MLVVLDLLDHLLDTRCNLTRPGCFQCLEVARDLEFALGLFHDRLLRVDKGIEGWAALMPQIASWVDL